MTERDTLWLTLLMLGLLAFMIGTPILYIYFRRKTAKPRIKSRPAFSDVPNPPEPYPQVREVKPAEPARPNLPKPKQATPEQRLKVANNVLFVLGGVSLLSGIFSLLASRAESANAVSMSFFSFRDVVVGLIYLGLALLVRRRSQVALLLAIVIFVLNGIASLVTTARNDLDIPILACTAGLLLFVASFLWNGWQAMRQLSRSATPPVDNEI